MSRRFVVRALVAAAAAPLLLAACGGGGSSNGLATKSASQILSSVRTAVHSASSATMTGSVLAGGHMITVDLDLFRSGDLSGTFGIGGATGSIRVIGSAAYFKGPARFWQELSSLGGAGLPQSAATKLANNWVSSTGGAQALGNLSLSQLTSSLAQAQNKQLTKVGTKTVNGQSAVGLKSSKQGTMWVATTGTPYPIEIEKTTSSGTEHVTFSGWNQASTPTKPAGAKSIQQLLG